MSHDRMYFPRKIVNVVDFGIFVKVHDEIDGKVHISDLNWDEKECQKILDNFKKGDKVKVKILEINIDKERISLGIKQLEEDGKSLTTEIGILCRAINEEVGRQLCTEKKN